MRSVHSAPVFYLNKAKSQSAIHHNSAATGGGAAPTGAGAQGRALAAATSTEQSEPPQHVTATPMPPVS
jgi:hypothetical protein